MRVFQIGFNKCGTTALFRMFLRSGVKPIHSGGRYWRRRNHPAIAGRNPQVEIHINIEADLPALTGLEDFQAFFDMEYVLDMNMPPVENFRRYRVFAEQYPTAKFILNTRNKSDWLRSRARHNDGGYVQRAMDRTGLDHDGVLDMWSEDFDSHHAAVRRYFADKPGRLLDFDIDHDGSEKLVDFLQPDIALKAEHWGKWRVTDEVAASKNWQVALAS